jgi:ribosomal protein S18 acetylase RimI-like enzyme
MVVAGQLLHDFNREYGELTPTPAELAARLRQVVRSGEVTVLLAGAGPDGLTVLRFRAALSAPGLECYLAEFYVRPGARGQGLGRALLEATLRVARERGAVTIDLGTAETDATARHLYESYGFTNRDGGPPGPLMYVYERDL